MMKRKMMTKKMKNDVEVFVEITQAIAITTATLLVVGFSMFPFAVTSEA